MKIVTYPLTAVLVMITVFAAGVTTGVYASAYKTKRQVALDECARYYNVYSCIEKPVPAQAPRVVYKEPDLLPPPVKGWDGEVASSDSKPTAFSNGKFGSGIVWR